MPVLPAPVEEVEVSLKYPGQVVCVFYSDDNMWHERVLLWKVRERLWMILTPDGDMCQESFELGPLNGPSKYSIQGVHFTNRSELRKPVYRFRQPLTRDELRDRITDAIRDLGGEVLAAGAWRPDHIVLPDRSEANPYNFLGAVLGRVRLPLRGGGIADPAPERLDVAALDLHPLKEAPNGFFWAFDDPPEASYFGAELDVSSYKGFRVGDYDGLVQREGRWCRVKMLRVDAGPAHFDGRRRLLGEVFKTPKEDDSLLPERASEEEPRVRDDARTLGVDYDEQGDRFKEWKRVVGELKEYSFGDWPHEGPLSTLHLCKHMLKSGGDPKLWLQVWARHKGIAETDRVMFELRTLIEIVHLGGTYDQLNMSSLASFESAARRIQSIVDAYSAGSTPDWGAARIITGYRGPDDAVSPQLRTWAARKGKEEVELAQARAKMKDGKRGLVAEEAAEALADGSLPSGSRAKPAPKSKGRGKGLEAPAGQ
eukprot:Skav226462  [mRNA]  locus=scaffold1781:97140:98588:+ [translate_table: standard]